MCLLVSVYVYVFVLVDVQRGSYIGDSQDLASVLTVVCASECVEERGCGIVCV